MKDGKPDFETISANIHDCHYTKGGKILKALYSHALGEAAKVAEDGQYIYEGEAIETAKDITQAILELKDKTE
ncbi:MAG: hypothetical protein KAS66_05200 [Candidatus Omnitrophica bacterium]|nr:hypothetical protein [Candidatus Omnitrophota bacterium]